MADLIKLRTYVVIDNMQPQYAAVTGTVVRGDMCLAGMSQLYIELEPGSAVFKVLDKALKESGAKPGFQIVEREYGEIELHSHSIEEIQYAGETILRELNLDIHERMEPNIVSDTVINNIDSYQAQLINRSDRYGSIVVPGETVLIMEVEPAAYIALALNEAEKHADIKIITFDPVGRFGRLYISGTTSEVKAAREASVNAIEGLKRHA